MISKEKMRIWERNDYDSSLNMIMVGYDPEMKEQYNKNSGFDIECDISDKEYFVQILYEIIMSFIGNKFIVRLKKSKFSWLPDWLKEEFNDFNKIEKYLDSVNWEKKKYFGKFIVEDVDQFLSLFVDYPLKYEYQDIEMFSVDSNYSVVISHHGTVWIISEEKTILRKIAFTLDSKGATVFPRIYLEAE